MRYIPECIMKPLRNFYSFTHPSRTEEMKSAIQETLRGNFFFINIGANDGFRGDVLYDIIQSNTLCSGIFIEPVPFVFRRLKKNYEDNTRFIFLNLAVSNDSKPKKLYYLAEDAAVHLKLPYWFDQLGSFDSDHIFKHFGREIKDFVKCDNVPCISFAEVLAQHSVNRIDVLVIDAEGYDYNIIEQIDFQAIRPELIIFECRHLSRIDLKKAKAIMKQNNYSFKQYGKDGLAKNKLI